MPKGLLLANFLDGDNVAIKFNFECQGHRDIILMSSYLQYEEKDLSGAAQTATIMEMSFLKAFHFIIFVF